jgi:hypothetical protein
MIGLFSAMKILGKSGGNLWSKRSEEAVYYVVLSTIIMIVILRFFK